jgi:hypothetical protein
MTQQLRTTLRNIKSIVLNRDGKGCGSKYKGGFTKKEYGEYGYNQKGMNLLHEEIIPACTKNKNKVWKTP